VRRPLLGLAALAAGVAATVALCHATLDPYALAVAAFAGINVILAVSLTLTNGFLGLFSLGHPAFMTVGGYVTALLVMPALRKAALLKGLPAWLAATEWPFLPALLAGGGAAALAALVVGVPVLRLRGHYLAVATLGLIFIVQSFAINMTGVTRGALGLAGLPELTTLAWVGAFVFLTLSVAWRLKHSSLGRTMLAIRENELAAACLGIDVARTRILAFALGAFFAGVGGGLWVHAVTLISPTSFGVLLAFQLVVIVVIGGTGSIVGAALVAVVLTALTEALRPLEEAAGVFGASQIAVALAVILVLVFRPAGLFGTREPVLEWRRSSAAPQP
jgi:branched-chain amino acid transport system permease protein